jgi:primosomal protein N''
LGKRKVVGLIESVQHVAPEGLGGIKPILDFLPQEYSLSPEILEVLRWAMNHYLAPPGEVLRSFLPPALLKGRMGKGERAKEAQLENFFSEEKLPQVILNEKQSQAIREVGANLGSFYPCLLHGITGSGKTEVYLELCREVLSRGQGVLILVPEISLTPQTVGRFVQRFVDKVGCYHSSLSEAQRSQTWWSARQGGKNIFIGTRSAVCLPVQNLGLIIVDEEHDSSYKQEERFRYHGRDLAVLRAKVRGIPVVLGSATPSVESWENVSRGKYRLLRLPERATQAELPQMHLIDLKIHPPHPETFLSEPLEKCLNLVMERGEQAMLFLNRRGYAPFLLCRDCGEVPRCPNCEISLTYHRDGYKLLCHYCEFSVSTGEVCAKCASPNLEPIGIGTERIEAELRKRFPKLRIGRLDRDVATSRNMTETVLSQFGKGELDVLIGTQIVAKGHDFRKLTLVGILFADVTLNFPDFRAAERLFQIVTQVSGRAGRHELPGQVFLQTYRPDHYSIQAALSQQHELFFVQEKSFREDLGYPPFSRMVLFRVSGIQEKRVEAACGQLTSRLRTLLKKFPEVGIQGPVQSTLQKLRGRFRWQVLLRTPKFERLRNVLGDFLPQMESDLPAGVRLTVDVDPMGVF